MEVETTQLVSLVGFRSSMPIPLSPFAITCLEVEILDVVYPSSLRIVVVLSIARTVKLNSTNTDQSRRRLTSARPPLAGDVAVRPSKYRRRESGAAADG